jgi:hypothetical protein
MCCERTAIFEQEGGRLLSFFQLATESGVRVFDTCVAIPTHPARGTVDDPRTLLGRAAASVKAQSMQPRGLVIVMDEVRGGAGRTRQLALEEALQTGSMFVSFLDSDDTWYPHHLETHHRLLCGESGAEDLGDVAYSWFDGNGVFPEHRGRAWNPAEPHHTTMTITVRAALAEQVGFAADHPEGWILAQEDWRFILGLNELGARFVGTGETTWTYSVHGRNTSGMATQGDAML